MGNRKIKWHGQFHWQFVPHVCNLCSECWICNYGEVCLASALLWVHFQMTLNAANRNKFLSQQQTSVSQSPRL